MSDRVRFSCDGEPVEVVLAAGETLLTVLRERLGRTEVKDGCAPQGQCGCCTVLVDGRPRVACVTPATRVAGREVTTPAGLPRAVLDRLTEAFTACGGSQCGFCTPGILVRVAPLLADSPSVPARERIDRALAAHLCRCTGWQPVREAIEAAAATGRPAGARDLGAASRRAALEGGTGQQVGPHVPLGRAGFADDGAPAGALVAVPAPDGPAGAAGSERLRAAGFEWIVAPTLAEARAAAGKVQGRRTTAAAVPPLAASAPPARPGVALRTSWVEPAYLEPDASWCAPGGEPASPLANGGAFGGKVDSSAPAAARELATQLDAPVRVVFAREDCVRLGPKRPPVSAVASVEGRTVVISGAIVRDATGCGAVDPPYALAVDRRWQTVEVPGPPVSAGVRAAGWAEEAVLVEGAIEEAGLDRAALVTDGRAGAVLLDSCVAAPGGALAGVRVDLDPVRGELAGVEVRVAAGDPLDAVVLRSYAVGAVHLALGWVLTEGLTVDPDTGVVHDLTIRSFGIVRPRDVPPVAVTVVDDPGPPRPASSDAVFAATAAALWNALARAEGSRPDAFPATATRAAARLRR